MFKKVCVVSQFVKSEIFFTGFFSSDILDFFFRFVQLLIMSGMLLITLKLFRSSRIYIMSIYFAVSIHKRTGENESQNVELPTFY